MPKNAQELLDQLDSIDAKHENSMRLEVTQLRIRNFVVIALCAPAISFGASRVTGFAWWPFVVPSALLMWGAIVLGQKIGKRLFGRHHSDYEALIASSDARMEQFKQLLRERAAEEAREGKA